MSDKSKLTRELIFDKATKPSERDYNHLISLISKLDKSDHLSIFKLIQNMDKKIYTINESGTLFDLSDLPLDIFWKMYEYCMMSIENIDREREKEKAKQEYDQNQRDFLQSFDKKMKINIHQNKSTTD